MSNTDSDIDKIRMLLSENVNSLSDKELVEEAIEIYGSEENALRGFDSIVDSAVMNARKRKLISAREEFERLSAAAMGASKVSQLSYEQKIVVLARVRDRVDEFPEEITRAARGELGDEKDIDTMLEDLEFLGFLDKNELLSGL